MYENKKGKPRLVFLRILDYLQCYLNLDRLYKLYIRSAGSYNAWFLCIIQVRFKFCD